MRIRILNKQIRWKGVKFKLAGYFQIKNVVFGFTSLKKHFLSSVRFSMRFYVETFSMIQNEIFRNQRHLQIFQQFKFQT